MKNNEIGHDWFHGTALAVVERVKAKGEPWEANGQQIQLGHYSIDRITTAGDVKAGCHFVKYAEIQRVAPMVKEAAHA